MKLMPASCAFAMIRFDVASSVGPPNIIVPKQIGDTLRPLRPSWRYCMGRVLAAFSGDSIAVSLRHCERSEAVQRCVCGGCLDCFAALAMTRLGSCLLRSQLSSPGLTGRSGIPRGL